MCYRHHVHCNGVDFTYGIKGYIDLRIKKSRKLRKKELSKPMVFGAACAGKVRSYIKPSKIKSKEE